MFADYLDVLYVSLLFVVCFNVDCDFYGLLWVLVVLTCICFNCVLVDYW